MSIGRRVRDLTVATLNDRLENAQDPIRAIDNFLREMADAIRETETLHRQCEVHTSNLRSQYLAADSMVRKRENQAMLAVKAGEDSVARAALAEKMLEEEKRDGFRVLYEQSENTLKELEQQLEDLRREYQEVYNKRQYYLARYETLRLQKQMQERTRSFAVKGQTWFHRLEDQITDMELEMRALFDVRSSTEPQAAQHGSIYGEDQVEQALEQLKRKLKGENEAR